jgi:hypothetical protein
MLPEPAHHLTDAQMASLIAHLTFMAFPFCQEDMG